MKYAIIENGIVKNIATADADFAAEQGWVACDNTVKIGFAYDGTSFSDTSERQKERIAELSASVRAKRDALLAETDWRFRSDLTASQEWIEYCQALRDVPAQEGFPTNVTWPTKP